MEVTKIAGVSVEEKEAIVKAGEIISSFAKAKASGEINAVNEETLNLFKAVEVVIDKVLDK